jgi:hypothetical protein
MRARTTVAVLLLGAASLFANDAPEIQHQPSSCTVDGQPISLCASISDDNQVARARIFFRKTGEKFYNMVEMTFGGLSYCGTLPAPEADKMKAFEYYVQAVDNEFETSRTSTYQIEVKPEGSCDFPPLEKDAARRSAIKVFATHADQGNKLAKGFDPAGVTFVPFNKK